MYIVQVSGPKHFSLVSVFVLDGRRGRIVSKSESAIGMD